MKKTNKQIGTAIMLCILLMNCNVSAKEAEEKEKSEQEIKVQVSITGHESGNIYKVTDAEGKVLRVDLGKHGGRMLNRHPFMIVGEIKQDEKGELIEMKRVEYEDPVVQIEKAAAKAAEEEENALEVVNDRDIAYSHELSKSHNKHYYTYNMANVEDLSAYKEVSITEIEKEEAGTKVAFVGSAVATVKKDEVMKFWGGPKIGGHINVVMNGAYVPLGQRSTVYGTVNDDGTISLDRLDSIE
jgi:hypothetical protein